MAGHAALRLFSSLGITTKGCLHARVRARVHDEVCNRDRLPVSYETLILS
jgi:hypothetical protein